MIIGAGKCGTSSLYEYINQHPDVYMSKPKEPCYFDTKDYEKGLEFYWKSYFKGWAGQKAIGEATPNYLPVPFVADRIKKSLPETKLITILRNPIDRAYSGWWMMFSTGKEKLSFEDAISQNIKRIEVGNTFEGQEGKNRWYDFKSNINCYEKGLSKYRTYLDHGYYSQQLIRYIGLFPKPQVKILLFEDLCHDPQTIVQDVWSFIEVNPKHTLKDKLAKNTAYSSRVMRQLADKITSTNIHKLFPHKITKPVGKLLSGYGTRPAMGKDIRNSLVDHYYRHNRELEKLIERDLHHWDR